MDLASRAGWQCTGQVDLGGRLTLQLKACHPSLFTEEHIMTPPIREFILDNFHVRAHLELCRTARDGQRCSFTEFFEYYRDKVLRQVRTWSQRKAQHDEVKEFIMKLVNERWEEAAGTAANWGPRLALVLKELGSSLAAGTSTGACCDVQNKPSGDMLQVTTSDAALGNDVTSDEVSEQPFMGCTQHDVEGFMESPAVISPQDAEVTARVLWADGIQYLPQLLNSTLSGVQVGSAPREEILLGKLNRMPKEVRVEFSEGVSLRQHRNALVTSGHSWKLASGAFVFVSPWQYELTMVALRDRQLHPDHVVFSASAEYLVEEALLRCKGPWMKDREPIERGGTSQRHSSSSIDSCSNHAVAGSDCALDSIGPNTAFDSDWRQYLSIERTFLCLLPVDSAGESIVTVLTSELHCSKLANPRRV